MREALFITYSMNCGDAIIPEGLAREMCVRLCNTSKNEILEFYFERRMGKDCYTDEDTMYWKNIFKVFMSLLMEGCISYYYLHYKSYASLYTVKMKLSIIPVKEKLSTQIRQKCFFP